MYTLRTLTTLIETAVDSKETSGSGTEEYRALHAIIQTAMKSLLPFPTGTGELTQEEISAAKYTGKLDAVKMYKERTKESLMDSKRAVENYFLNNNLKFKGYS